MERKHDALERAIHHFSSQQGTTSSQVAQLRAALDRDATAAAALAAFAEAGRLRAIELASPGSALPPVGRFDPTKGVLMIPRATFDEESGAGHGLAATLRVQSMLGTLASSTYLDNAGSRRPVTDEMVSNLQSVLNGSPALAEQVKKAAMTEDGGRRALERFDLEAQPTHGGSYSGETRTMSLRPASLVSTRSSYQASGFQPDNLTFILGHEVEHSFRRAYMLDAATEFHQSIRRISASKSPVHDYTSSLDSFVGASRTDEAAAEVSGWNALLSRKRQENPGLTMRDMAFSVSPRTDDFVIEDSMAPSGFRARDGLTMDKDMSLPMTDANIKAMGRHYFDRPSPEYPDEAYKGRSTDLGYGADYRTYYATPALSRILEAEAKRSQVVDDRRSSIVLDMDRLGLHENLLEKYGLSVKPMESIQYFDTSHGDRASHHFDHTMSGEHAHQHVPILCSEARAPSTQLHDELRDLLPPDVSEDRLAQIAAAAKLGGIEPGSIRSMDVADDRLTLTGHTPGAHAAVDLSVSPPPMVQSNAQYEAAAVHQQNVQEQVQQAVQQSGPTMSMGR